MKTNYEIRYAAHPEDAKNYDTTRIRLCCALLAGMLQA